MLKFKSDSSPFSQELIALQPKLVEKNKEVETCNVSIHIHTIQMDTLLGTITYPLPAGTFEKVRFLFPICFLGVIQFMIIFDLSIDGYHIMRSECDVKCIISMYG